MILVGQHDAPTLIFSMTLGMSEVSICMVGDMLAIFHSSNASREGIGF